MTKEQSKAHWWIVENHPDFRIEPPKKYFEICDIVYNALKQGQLLPIDSVVGQIEQFNCGKERVFGEKKCDKQCNDCLKEYGSN